MRFRTYQHDAAERSGTIDIDNHLRVSATVNDINFLGAILSALTGHWHRYLRRFRLAMEQWGTAIVNLSLHIEACFKKWQNGLVEASKGTLEPLQGHIQGLLWKVQREQEQIKARPVSQLPNNYTRSSLEEALLAQIATTHYDEPGQLRPEGPRHDNDDDDFQCIEIAPTNSELQCEHPPALPINHPAAPHHLPLGTMKRHLDVHFRLYREEFV